MIIAVTGHSEKIYEEKALNSGMNLVLNKPVIPNQLEDMIRILGFQKSETNYELDDNKLILNTCNDSSIESNDASSFRLNLDITKQH